MVTTPAMFKTAVFCGRSNVRHLSRVLLCRADGIPRPEDRKITCIPFHSFSKTCFKRRVPLVRMQGRQNPPRLQFNKERSNTVSGQPAGRTWLSAITAKLSGCGDAGAVWKVPSACLIRRRWQLPLRPVRIQTRTAASKR